MKIIAAIISTLPLGFTAAHGQLAMQRTADGFGKMLRHQAHRQVNQDLCSLECSVDSDCPMVCSKANDEDTFGTCIVGTSASTPQLTSPQLTSTQPTKPQLTSPKPTSCEECITPKIVPNVCEVDILIDMMETSVIGNHELLPQWTRAAFHDAGTYNQETGEGGANGCLLNFLPMRREPENNFFDLPLNTLMTIKDEFNSHRSTCVEISSADILQFAIFFATTRQKDTPESLVSGTSTANAKRATLRDGFLWGRPDEQDCDTLWVENLPNLNSAEGGPITGRCTAAGAQIKDKMIDRNGFTAEEATVLIGAHTIGLIRNTFGASLAGPWVTNGKDDATPFGGVFDNAYHSFLVNEVEANNALTFAQNVNPFTAVFPDWFRNAREEVNHLDTDIVLAFPSLDTSKHPHYNTYTNNFAASNESFLNKFFEAMHKMGKLGVNSTLLSPVSECLFPCGFGTEEVGIGLIALVPEFVQPSRPEGTEEVGDGKIATEPEFVQPSRASLGLTTFEVLNLIQKLGNATAHARQSIQYTQTKRKYIIEQITVTVSNTQYPSTSPSLSSSPSVSSMPSFVPSVSSMPTDIPSGSPSYIPSISSMPTDSPSESPSYAPSISSAPSQSPSVSSEPSTSPTGTPSLSPSSSPSVSSAPSESPSESPTESPSESPTESPSESPSELIMSMSMSKLTTFNPTVQPTVPLSVAGVTITAAPTTGEVITLYPTDSVVAGITKTTPPITGEVITLYPTDLELSMSMQSTVLPTFSPTLNPTDLVVSEITKTTAPTSGAVTTPDPTDLELSMSMFTFSPTSGSTADLTESETGTCGDGDRGNGICPVDGLCCSEFGYCGTGDIYCGEVILSTYDPTPSPQVSSYPTGASTKTGTTVTLTTALPTSPDSIIVETPQPTTTKPKSLEPTSLTPTILATSLPPTSLSPTSPPSMSLSPSDVSSDVPSDASTALLPTSLEPTSLPPTSLLPTSLSPTSLPPTSLPPTSIPPTSIPPTSLTPSSLPPTLLISDNFELI